MILQSTSAEFRADGKCILNKHTARCEERRSQHRGPTWKVRSSCCRDLVVSLAINCVGNTSGRTPSSRGLSNKGAAFLTTGRSSPTLVSACSANTKHQALHLSERQ